MHKLRKKTKKRRVCKMKIQAYSNTNVHSSYNAQNNPSFKGVPNPGKFRRAFEWLGDQCNISSNGSLTRAMFFVVGTVFMLGGRFFESRDNDEKREVVTRDVPAVALSAGGAPLINVGVAYALTKKTGVPILDLGKKGNLSTASLSSQKQIINWYSDLGENALVNFSETVNKHGGNLRKVFKKLGFTDKLDAITNAAANNDIIDAIKEAQKNGTDAFNKLETAMKGLGADNKLLKSAKKYHAYVKLGGIAFMATLLGYLLPRLNIITTRKKYEGKVDEARFEKMMMRTSPVFRVSSGVLSFHKASAAKTFKNLLNMLEEPVQKAEK